MSFPITLGAEITLNNDDNSCFLAAAGTNEQPTVRIETGKPLLSFEKCVFTFVREIGGVVTTSNSRPLQYGGVVNLYSPVTKTAAVVLKTEQSDGSVGLRVVMRPLDERSSLFRIQPKFKSRQGSDSVMHGDSVVLMVDNSDLFLCVGEGHRGLEVVATGEPAVWGISRYDKGASQSTNQGIVYAGRVLALHHRLHQTTLVNAPPTIPSNHRAQNRRHTLWQPPAPDLVHTEATTITAGSRNRHAAILDEPTTDVHFVSHTAEGDDATELPCGSLWIAENVDPTTGGPLVAGERYRFRHFVTGHYLCIVAVGSASVEYLVGTLPPDHPDLLDRSLWDIESSAENELGYLSAYHSYVRLRHVSTGQWLGACAETDFAVVPAIPTTKTHSRDRLLMKHAPKTVEADLFFAMAQLDIVKDYITHFRALQDFPRSADRVIMSNDTRTVVERTNEACLALISFASAGENPDIDLLGLPDPDKQRRLGELSAVELILTAILAPFQSRGIEPSTPIAGGAFTLSDVHRKEFAIVHTLLRTFFKLIRQIVFQCAENAAPIMKHFEVLLYLESCNFQLGAALSALASHVGHFQRGDDLRASIEKLFVLNQRTRHHTYIEALSAACSSPEAVSNIISLLDEYPSTLTATLVELGRLIIYPEGDSEVRTGYDNAMPIEMFIAHGDAMAVTFYIACSQLVLAIAKSQGTPVAIAFCTKIVSRDEILLVLSCGFRDAKSSHLADSLKATYTELAAVLYLASDLQAAHQPRVMVVSAAAASPQRPQAVGTAGTEGPFMRQMKLIALETLKANTNQVLDLAGRNSLLWQSTIVWHMFVKAHLASPSELQEVIPMLISILDGATDVLSTSTTTDQPWDRYAMTEENAAIVNTKVEICKFLRTFFQMRCEDAVGEVVHAISSHSTAAAIHKMALGNFDSAIQCVERERLYKILLDLVLYESHELRRASTNLLADIVRHRHIIAGDVEALHVLSSKHSESYTRVVELVGLVQASTTSRNDPAKTHEAFLAIGQLTSLLHNLLGTTNEADVETMASGTSGAAGGIEYLDLLRMWNVHTMVLDIIPAADDNTEGFSRCTEFFSVFCHNEANQPLVAPRWPMFFDAMEAHPGELGRAVLGLLSRIWSKGNAVCPAERRDIRFVMQMFARDETNVDALRALVALLSSGVPAPQQQRHIVVLLQEFDVVSGQWWMTRPPACVLTLTRLLELCCAGNNSFTRRVVQSKFPIGMVLRIIASSGVSRIGFKTALVRFLAIAHFAPEEDTPHHALVQQAKQLVLDENWWRLVRDDFLVRMDEVASGIEVQKQIKPFVLEVSLTLESFFSNRFGLGLATSKTDWLLKEVRGVLTTICHLIQNLGNLDFTAQEKQVFVALGRAVAQATASLNDGLVKKLQGAVETVVVSGNVAPRDGEEERDKEAVLLAQVQQIFREALPADSNTVVDVLLPLIRPQNNNDKHDWRRRVLKRLLSACAIQDFDGPATTTVLQLCRRCIETTPKARALGMQILFENIGGLRTGTVLMDAVNPHIVIEALKFGIAVIDNGAREVQDDFLDYLESNDEKFFVAMKRCVDKAVLELQYWRRLIVQSAGTNFDLRSEQTCFSYVSYVMRFVQLMCEGHHHGMQEYVREQKDNLRSVNALQIALLFLRAILTGDTTPFEDELIQSLELLTEFCQGPCVGNQSLLLSANACGTLNAILDDSHKSPNTKLAAVTTLLSLLEGCTDTTVAETILRQVPLHTIRKVFMLSTESEENAQLVFSVGILLRNLSDLVASKPTLQFPLQQLLKQRKDVGLHTGRIQVERGGLLESVYFRIPAPCTRIGEESKLKLLWNVDRSSQAAKHSSFYELCDDLILELDLMERQQAHMQHLVQRYVPLILRRYFAESFGYSIGAWIHVSLFLAIGTNLLFLADFDSAILSVLLALAQAVVSAIICYIDWVVDGAVFFHKYKKEQTQRMLSKSEDYLDVPEVTISKRREWLLMANRSRFRFCVVLLAAALMAIFGFEALLVTHVFWVITLSPAFANVIAAITQNAKTLSLTIVLGLLFCYSFAMIGFAMFPGDFDNDADENSHENCNSLLHCFLFITTTGLRQGGGIGDVMREKNWGSEHFFKRKAFDFLFFAVMIIVFLNILFGIIIDTFAELRDAKTRKEDDMRLKCFICGIDSHVFDRHGEGFVWHTKHEHNMWQYLYFIYHLRLKDPNDYTGQESYIAARLDSKDFSFFPTRCLSLETSWKTENSEGDTKAQAEHHVTGTTSVAMDHVSQEMKCQFDNIRTTVRRVLQRNMLVEGNSADAQYRVTKQPDGRTVRHALDSGTQTHLSESVASLQYELAAAESAKARLHADIETMKAEMKAQVEELWKLKVSNLNSAELHQNIHILRNEVKDLQRQVALVSSEKETSLRQNAFLQDEVDRLLLANAKFHAGEKLHAAETSQPAVGLTADDTLKQVALDRSRMYESLQMTLPDTSDEADDEEGH